jgi:hypothetical protein
LGVALNRITVNIPFQPFNLKEVQNYLKYQNHQFSKDQVLQIYMVMGGIPHYLNSLKKNFSISQNINAQCFQAVSGTKQNLDRNLQSSG